MNSSQRPRICMMVTNEVARDSRVIRAASAVNSVYDLLVLGVDKGRAPLEPDKLRASLGFPVAWAPLRFSGKLPRNTLGYAARYAEAAWRLVARCVRFRPNLIHAHDLNTLPMAVAARRLSGGKLVYDAHELYRDQFPKPHSLAQRLSYRFETSAMQDCDGIIACNSYRAEIMLKEYGAPHLPTVVRNVPAFQAPRDSQVLRQFVAAKNPALRRLCLHQGGIQPGRGLEVTVRALPLLPEDVGLVLVGGGGQDYLDKLVKLAQELGMANRFFLHPSVDYAELFELTCSADVGIIIYRNISRNNYYCAPNKLYEYAAAGLPMVGADLPPIRDFFERYGAGETFDTEDEKSLAQAILRILGDPEKCRQYREKGLAAAGELCWENESKILLELYRKILGR